MKTELTAADGHKLDCWMRPAEGTAHGGLVIVQEIFGVTDQMKRVAAQYAQHGYQVAVPALFDRQEKGAVIPFDQPQRGRAMMQKTRLEETMMDIAAAVDTLREGGHAVGVIGFCWGGGLALRAAQELDVACAVAFYGTRMKEYLDKPLKAPVLAHCGTTDDHTPPEVMDAVKEALPEVEVQWYEAGHAFANDARPAAFSAEAAELAHGRTVEFLRTHLG